MYYAHPGSKQGDASSNFSLYAIENQNCNLSSLELLALTLDPSSTSTSSLAPDAEIQFEDGPAQDLESPPR